MDVRLKREVMVSAQIEARGISDKAVLSAVRTVPRHAFVSEALRDEAYGDWALPIGEDQTISQPYIVAYMTEALRVEKGSKVLEIGTGSGYQAAVLSAMGADVYSIEIVRALGERAARLLKRLGYKVHTRIGDGFDGWPDAGPFDAIIVTAAPETLPPSLIAQLRVGGRIAVPLGRELQNLNVFVKTKTGLDRVDTLPVRFVPMTGKSEARSQDDVGNTDER